jgi:DNA-directed RNA polymerase subunit RPC12/RpoP
VKRYLYYCSACKLRFQNQNFGYGYPRLNAEGAALCPYCEARMQQTLDDAFPADWVEERPTVALDESSSV